MVDDITNVSLMIFVKVILDSRLSVIGTMSKSRILFFLERINMKTAVLVDGGFFLKRYNNAFGRDNSPEEVATFLHKYCYKHLQEKSDTYKSEMYRILYYDCEPLDINVFHPIDGNINLKKQPLYSWKNKFLNELKQKRKLALRMGELSLNKTGFTLKRKPLKKIMNGSMQISDLTFTDFELNIEQKGVDMRIGLDVASLAYKKQVDRIVLIAGDSDFVPVAKLARREGIDFILDPLYNQIKDSLFEHIDGLHSKDKTFNNRNKNK